MKTSNHFHFIGICGIGMSGIAKILLQQGFQVSGCDQNQDPQRTTELEQLGCLITHHQSSQCSNPTITTVVRSSDVPLTHPEIIQAQQKNITIKHRAEILAHLMSQKNSIAIAGAHGKTTTTALMAHVLLEANLHPSIMVGGHVHALNSNAQHGTGSFMVSEADESDRSFLLLPKKYSIVTNIDREHLNTYQNFDDIKQSFIQFLNTTNSNGCNFICIDDPGIQSITSQITYPYQTYGFDQNADFQIKNIRLHHDHSIFNVHIKKTNQTLQDIQVSLPGKHNILNATGVIGLSLTLGVDENTLKNALKSFQGVDRRFTFKGHHKSTQALIYDDYGHHPTELQVTLEVVQNKPQNKIIMVFQPQRYSRTMHLWNEFVQVLAHANIDHLIITDIYPANELPVTGIDSQHLVAAIKHLNPTNPAQYIPFGQDGTLIVDFLNHHTQTNDLILFQGAGKVNKLICKLL